MPTLSQLLYPYLGPPKSYEPKPPPEVFEQFKLYKGPFKEGFEYDFLGTATNLEFMNRPSSQQRATALPGVSEEYFEWMDVLTAARQARGRFVMLEWGAGFGRWGVIGGGAARLCGVDNILLGFAEAEPTHAKWLREHIVTNGFRADQVRVDECAVSNRNGKTLFYTGMPEGSDYNNPGEWYGQAIAAKHEKAAEDKGGEVEFASGWKGVEVELREANALLEGFGEIDLLDMDIQGEERHVVPHCIKTLNKIAKRVHVGTHATDIENQLRRIFSWNGWVPVHDFGCGAVRDTPYGKVSFGDGVQSWLNPRLARAS